MHSRFAAPCVIVVSIAVVSFSDFTHATNVSYQLHMLGFLLNPSTNQVRLYIDSHTDLSNLPNDSLALVLCV
ncbi:exported hypothetical protein [Vibrio coralliirubri]|nr:exported hypothetical protein [Vibrio coralliirubri]